MLNVVPAEERAHGTISNKTYYIYLREGASAFAVLLFVIIFLFAEVSNGCDLASFIIVNCLFILG